MLLPEAQIESEEPPHLICIRCIANMASCEAQPREETATSFMQKNNAINTSETFLQLLGSDFYHLIKLGKNTEKRLTVQFSPAYSDYS